MPVNRQRAPARRKRSDVRVGPERLAAVVIQSGRPSKTSYSPLALTQFPCISRPFCGVRRGVCKWRRHVAPPAAAAQGSTVQRIAAAAAASRRLHAFTRLCQEPLAARSAASPWPANFRAAPVYTKLAQGREIIGVVRLVAVQRGWQNRTWSSRDGIDELETFSLPMNRNYALLKC